jgi:hypothetical protein
MTGAERHLLRRYIAQQSAPINSHNLADDPKTRIEIALDILAKKYQNYMWCEQKITALATANTIFLGGLFVVAGSRYSANTPAKIAILGACIAAFASCLALMLYHTIPRMRSGAIPKGTANLRSAAGVRKFATTDAYYQSLAAADYAKMLRDISDQIYGMNKNIWRSQNIIRIAVCVDLAGLLLFIAIVVMSSFATQPAEKAPLCDNPNQKGLICTITITNN